ncbi:Leptomycin B resistance protein pmd1-like protein 8 [Seiridium cupressi]
MAYGWRLGLLLTFGALPLLVASGYVRMRLEFKLDDDTPLRFVNSAGIASEAGWAIRTVASLALEREILTKYEESLRFIAKASVKSLVKHHFLVPPQSVYFLPRLGTLILQFHTVFIAVIFSGEAAASLFTYTSSLTQAQGAANFIFSLRNQISNDTKDNCFPENEKSDHDGAVTVECKVLEFAYPRQPAISVLKSISLSIQPGQFVTFDGASGCGKTTSCGSQGL